MYQTDGVAENLERHRRPPTGVRWFVHHAPYFGGTLGILIGLYILWAWLSGHVAWATVLPGLPAMVPHSAIMAILQGLSLILATPADTSPVRKRIARLCAAVVIVIGGAMILESAFGVDLRIDQLIPSVADAPYPVAHPGRASPQTALVFVLLASALLLLDSRTLGGKRPAEVLALIGGFVPLIALLGYIFGAAELYQPFTLYPYFGMGLATAITLLSLSWGTIAARAEGGLLAVLLEDNRGGFVARRLTAWLLALAGIACLVAVGERLGFYNQPIETALIVLIESSGGIALILVVLRRLSRLDAKQRQVSDELQDSRRRLDLALRGADLAAWDWNVQSGHVITSPRWAEMRGYSPNEIAPAVDAWIADVHPDDWPAVEKALTDYLEGRSPEYETEHRLRTKAGGWIWILSRGKVFERDAQGRPVRMVGTALDITTHKRSAERLRIAEAKSSGILSISADAIISIDDKQRITLFNAGAERAFGYSKDEVIGKPIEMLIPERFRIAHHQHVEEFAAGPQTARRAGERTMDILGLRKNGEEFPADAAISKLDIDKTRVLTVALRDISEQRKSENEKTLLAEVGAIVTSSLDYTKTLPIVCQRAARSFADFCIVDLASEGTIERLAVVSRQGSHAWICDALMEVPLWRVHSGVLEQVLDTQRTRLSLHVSPEDLAPSAQTTIQRQLLDAIGLTSVIAVPLMARGDVLGAMTFVRTSASAPYGRDDVSLAAEIAGRAALATENGQHYYTAQAAIQARDDVLGIVAHDLRNPLGTILMQANVLRDISPAGDGASGKGVDIIVRAAKRMNRLIQDLLVVSRVEAGKLSIEREQVDVNRLLSQVVDSQLALAESHGVALVLDVAPGLEKLSGDEDRLLQLFENLIGNAVKFTEAGGNIVVAANRKDGDVLFSVRDTGRGIEPDALPHIFDRFWQAQQSRKGGAGLGLQIVKGIVEAHGGRIWVESAPLHGTTFYFTIPAALRVQPARRSA
jgi:PAS domain S-box-containing protein